MSYRLCFWIVWCWVTTPSYAWDTRSLWLTPNQHAAALMKKNQFSEAEQLFTDPLWKATAAYKARNYRFASQQFGSIGTADGFYNQGNALAQLKQYAEALHAYDQSLAIRPHDADTLHNRALVKQRLQHTKKQPPSEQKQTKQPSAPQSKTAGQPQSSSPESSKDASESQHPMQENTEQSKANQPMAAVPPSEQPPAKPQTENASEQPKPDSNQSAPNTAAPKSNAESNPDGLRLIPDDPGGLLKQKLLRDHLRRMQKEEE